MTHAQPTTRGILSGTVADRRQPKKIGRLTDAARLEQLRSLLADVLLDPSDHRARRDAGRMACTVGLVLLDESDDRRRLMLDLLADGLAHAAPSSSTTTEAHR